jgi:hypothetical protein
MSFIRPARSLHKSRPRPKFRLLLEALEERVLLADGITPHAGAQLTGTIGVALSNATVATFDVATAQGSPGTKWNARIDWGDGTQDKRVSATAVSGSTFGIKGTHTYSTAGSFTITVHIAVPGSHLPNDNVVSTPVVISASTATLQSISVTPANPSIAKGLKKQFTATGTFSDGSTKDISSQVTWASATSSVATITTAGLASGVGTGTSTISASLSGKTGSTLLTVTTPTLQSIAVTPANSSIAKGLTQQFTATGTFSDNSKQDLTSQATWASSIPSVATISATGLATGVGNGTTVVSAALSGVTGSTQLASVGQLHFTVTAPASAQAGSPLSVTLTAQDPGDNTVTAYIGKVHFTTSDPATASTLPQDYTFTAADKGVHVFAGGAILVTAGPQTITATDSVTAATGNAQITVTPATTHHFKVTAPATAAAGTPVSVIVTALDQFNNPTGSAYTGTVHFKSTDAAATLPADTPLTAGAGTVTATLNTAGTQTITASDTAVAAINGTSDSIVVSAAAGRFTVDVPSTATAGSPFLVIVTAIDSSGHTNTGYTGTVQLTSTDPKAVLAPANATLTSGAGGFLATLKTVAGSPWAITATDSQTPALAGTSAKITVTPGPASFFSVAASANAVTTGSPLSVTVTAFDSFGNVATGYNGRVHLTSTDPHSTLPLDSTLSAGVGAFSVTLNTAGNQSITATDTVSTNPVITGATSAITARGLVVAAAPTVTADGFTVNFSKPFIPGDIVLYGAGQTLPDVALAGKVNGPITGTVLVDPASMSLTFKATANTLAAFFGDPILPDDTYTLTLISGTGSHGFHDALGAGLDGANDGGHANYTANFVVANVGKAILSIPDFARGPAPADAVKVPNDSGHGIPITLAHAAGVKDVAFTLSYNPALLTVTGASTADATAAASTFTLVGMPTIADGTHASANFTYHSGTAQSGTVILGDILASVPGAAASTYKAKELLSLGSVTVNGAAFTGLVGSGVHINAYFGDASGNGTIDGLDVALANNLAQGKSTGFAAFQQGDPAIVADVANDISVDAGDVSTLAAFTVHLPTPVTPPIPTGLTITPFGADPTLRLGAVGRIGNPSYDGAVMMPVLLDNPHPDGSTGMTEAILALNYDPAVLSVSSSDITLGTLAGLDDGWKLTSVIDPATGQIGIVIFGTTPLQTTQAGSLVNITFHVIPGTSAPATAVRLMSTTTAKGQAFTTQVDDAQGQLVLSPGADQVVIETGAVGSLMGARGGNLWERNFLDGLKLTSDWFPGVNPQSKIRHPKIV